MEEDKGVRMDALQRFLDSEALRGTPELDAWRALGYLLGLSFPAKEDVKPPEK